MDLSSCPVVLRCDSPEAAESLLGLVSDLRERGRSLRSERVLAALKRNASECRASGHAYFQEVAPQRAREHAATLFDHLRQSLQGPLLAELSIVEITTAFAEVHVSLNRIIGSPDSSHPFRRGEASLEVAQDILRKAADEIRKVAGGRRAASLDIIASILSAEPGVAIASGDHAAYALCIAEIKRQCVWQQKRSGPAAEAAVRGWFDSTPGASLFGAKTITGPQHADENAARYVSRSRRLLRWVNGFERRIDAAGAPDHESNEALVAGLFSSLPAVLFSQLGLSVNVDPDALMPQLIRSDAIWRIFFLADLGDPKAEFTSRHLDLLQCALVAPNRFARVSTPGELQAFRKSVKDLWFLLPEPTETELSSLVVSALKGLRTMNDLAWLLADLLKDRLCSQPQRVPRAFCANLARFVNQELLANVAAWCMNIKVTEWVAAIERFPGGQFEIPWLKSAHGADSMVPVLGGTNPALPMHVLFHFNGDQGKSQSLSFVRTKLAEGMALTLLGSVTHHAPAAKDLADAMEHALLMMPPAAQAGLPGLLFRGTWHFDLRRGRNRILCANTPGNGMSVFVRTRRDLGKLTLTLKT